MENTDVEPDRPLQLRLPTLPPKRRDDLMVRLIPLDTCLLGERAFAAPQFRIC
jgi:hypothetical protein